VFIFHVDVTRIKKFPIVKQFAVKPWMYDLAFTTDKVMKDGTLDKSMCPWETEMGGDKEKDTHTANVDEEENVRAAKKT
jgi:hypothetical protein